MRFLQIHNFYDLYLEDFYSKRPELSAQPFERQMQAIVEDGFSGNHIMSPYLRAFGWETSLAVPNCRHAQLQWAKEHGLTVRDASWTQQILMAQIETFKPDVIYCTSPIDFDSGFMRLITVPVKLIAGWRAAEIPEHTDFSEYDLMLSSDPYSRETLSRKGVERVVHFVPGFPRFIAEKVKAVEKRYDVMFTGQYGHQHRRRNELLNNVAVGRTLGRGDYSVAYYLARSPQVPLPPALAPIVHPACFGIEMYSAIKRGRIALNAVIDFAKGEAGNMRQFEVTGSGSFLLTEHHETLGKYFEVGKEIESFRSPEDLLEKIYYYLDHPAEREAIALRGQERCLRDHSMELRAEEFKTLIEGELRTDPRAKRRSQPKEDAAGAAPAAGTLDVQVNRALELVKQGKPLEAYQFLSQESQGKPAVRDLNFVLGIALIQLGETKAAETLLAAEVRAFPDNSAAITLLRELSLGA